MLVHLDTDFLVWALTRSGPERRRLLQLADSPAELQMSAVAWYEYCRGPRTPEQVAVAHSMLEGGGIVTFSEDIARHAAEVFRRLGSPRRRSADIAIGATAALSEALLLTRNPRDFADIPGLHVETVDPTAR